MRMSKKVFLIFENAFVLTNILFYLHDNNLFQKSLNLIKV